jgi:ComF family protein
MNPIEKILNLIAPEYCLGCGQENYLLCPSCYNSLPKLGSICFVCQKATPNHEPCQTHKTKQSPEMVFCINKYEALIKEYVKQYKFETKRSAGIEIAKYINDDLPMFDKDYIVTWVPTTPNRIRHNGYDHSYLIAKNFAKLRGLTYRKLINKKIDTPLHNLKKQERINAIKDYYEKNKLAIEKNSKIILIDDIATTGTTINYVSKLLKKSGAQEVIACVFAKTF